MEGKRGRGRPKYPDDGRQHAIKSVRVDEGEWKVAAAYAELDGRSMSDLIRRLVAEHNRRRLAK